MSGRVIKAGDSRVVMNTARSLDLRDIAAKADEMLAAARAQASAIVAAAHDQANAERASIHQASRAEGYARGLAEGLLAGEKSAIESAARKFAADQSGLLSALSAALTEFEHRREQFYSAARRDVVILAVAIASRIARRFAMMEELAPEIAADAAREALQLVREATDVTIVTHPADLAAVRELATELSQTLKSLTHLRVVEDEQIDRGSVRVGTSDTRIDASIQDRIERIADELVDHWRDRMNSLGISP